MGRPSWDDPGMHPRKLAPQRAGRGQTFSSAGYNILAPQEPVSPSKNTIAPSHGDIIAGSPSALTFRGVAREHTSAPDVLPAGQRNYSPRHGRGRQYGIGVDNGNILLPGDDNDRGVTSEQLALEETQVGHSVPHSARKPQSPATATTPSAAGSDASPARSLTQTMEQAAEDASGVVEEEAIDQVVNTLVSTVIEEVTTPREGQVEDSQPVPVEVKPTPTEADPLQDVAASPVRPLPDAVGGTPERPQTAKRIMQPPGGASSFSFY